jgi:hypothetical protein
MKTKHLFIFLFVLSASVGAFAIPITPGPCPTGPYSGYLGAGFSCIIGDKTFSNFRYAGVNIGAGDVTVTPTSSGGEFGFDFTAAWQTSGIATVDSFIDYTVTAGPGFLIDDAVLTIEGFGASGLASVSVADNFFHGSSNTANLLVFFNPLCNGLNNCVTTDAATFAGVQSLNVFKDIAVSSLGGVGHLSFVSNTVSQVPEPASLALLGSSLLGLGHLIRKKKKLFTA